MSPLSALVFLSVAVLLVEESGSEKTCVLDGLWYDPASPRSAQRLYRFSNFSESGETVVAVTPNGRWSTGRVSVSGDAVSVSLDDGENRTGLIQVGCEGIVWFEPPSEKWVRVPQVDKVHVVFMNHLDVGYNGIPQVGFVNNVLNTYFQEYFPRAVRLALEMAELYPGEGFIYTTHPWLVSLYLDCPPDLVLSGIKLYCPTKDEVAGFEQAILKGYIVWHAGAMNMQMEFMNEAVLKASLQIAADLDQRFGHKTTVLSQRDVPGLTTAAIPFLLENGVEAITVGVNPGSAPPDVPSLFLWEYEGQQIIAMWHPGGYPLNPGDSIANAGGLSYMDVVYSQSEVLAFAFRTDNSGPPTSVQEVLSYYEILRGEFPGASVFPSTFESFVSGIDRGSLALVQGEIGDTWIQGVLSDPLKVSQYRAMSGAYAQCFLDKLCTLSNPQVNNASRFLVKFAEHTWGLASVYDTVNWTNNAFEKVRKDSNFQNCQSSWLEQRQFLNLTLEACSGHPLHDYITDALSQLKPVPPSLQGYKIVSASQTFDLFQGQVQIAFSSKEGWIDKLIYKTDTKTVVLATEINPLVLLTYNTYNQSDIDYMESFYDYYGDPGYTKPNVTINAHPNSSTYYPLLDTLYQSSENPSNFIAKVTFDSFAHSYYGAPSLVWVSVALQVNESSPLNVSIEIFLVNKTPTRLPEATMLSFYPQRMHNDSKWSGTMYKISDDTPISLDSVLQNGSQYQHFVQKAVLTEISSSPDNVVMTVIPSDVPLVCPITTNGHTPTPFPAPLSPLLSSELKGIAFNLHNNVWNTNWPLWYPFINEDANIKMRFSASFNLT